MEIMEFRQQIQGEVPVTNPGVKYARALWVCYYIKMELYEQEARSLYVHDRAEEKTREEARRLTSQLLGRLINAGLTIPEIRGARDTVTDITGLDFGKLSLWAQQEDWLGSIMPLLQDGRRPSNGR